MKQSLRTISLYLFSLIALLYGSTQAVDAGWSAGSFLHAPASVYEDNSELNSLSRHVSTPGEHKRLKAACIYQRYYERLQALFTSPAPGHTDVTRTIAFTETHTQQNAVYSSRCLSTCYDYIFRLSLF
ncbi:hypothetical protein [Taibaiella helva]|uniref:hypothetical protein n=1 Tax=Taibaiella helva TaxID=2301235 RepID=UPI0013001C70|nr:hypothetical protein [Taibaiella helva]